MYNIKYNSDHQWLIGDVLFEIFDDVENDTLEITHYGHTECCLRVISSADDNVSIGVDKASHIVVYNPRKLICWEHCE